ncbi:MAG: GGDEF domain-containing protein [Campylobacterota bacterium]|nr:GGDEF domain-containing protein [Campylobacterota bacterium]
MKHSIKKIFNSLFISLVILTITLASISLLMLEQANSYKKIDNLQNQKKIIKSLINLKHDDIELALIRFNGRSIQLQHEIDKLRNLNSLDYTGKYLQNYTDDYLQDLNKLSKLTGNFNKSARSYYVKDLNNQKEKKQELIRSSKIISNFIDTMLLKNITYTKLRFFLFEKITYFAFFLAFIVVFWYRKKLNLIYKDIVYLSSVNKTKTNYEIFSLEIDAIQLRMGRKPSASDNPAMIDPVTQINNNKGLINSYSEKKGLKDSNFTSVTIFEIDNFSKQRRAFSQEFTQAILKKVAFAISLHEQATDVIARTDYNQFTVVLSRASKKQSFKDVDIIRQSIAEIKLKEPGGDSLIITTSGGFVIKPNNQSLEDAIKEAGRVLKYAKENNRNSVAQVSDLANDNL